MILEATVDFNANILSLAPRGINLERGISQGSLHSGGPLWLSDSAFLWSKDITGKMFKTACPLMFAPTF